MKNSACYVYSMTYSDHCVYSMTNSDRCVYSMKNSDRCVNSMKNSYYCVYLIQKFCSLCVLDEKPCAGCAGPSQGGPNNDRRGTQAVNSPVSGQDRGYQGNSRGLVVNNYCRLSFIQFKFKTPPSFRWSQ